MEDFTGFDLSGILSEDEADKLFEEQADVQETETPEVENEPAEKEEVPTSEGVGEEEDNENENDAISTDGDGSSPNIYSSIASALKDDGIFSDLEDTDLDSVKTPEDFAELFEKVVSAKLDERQKRIDAALSNGVEPNTVKMYEQTLQYLASINEEALSAEGEEGDNLRRQLIYNDLTNRGYSHEKAVKELEKSFKSGSDVEDAKDALEALTNYYNEGYANVQKEAKAHVEEAKRLQKKQADDFRKLVLEDEVKLGESKLDKKTCQRVYDAVSKPVYKDKETGQLLTAVQQFQKEHPLEFLKQLGMWFVLTDGGKNTDGFTKQQLREEKNKSIKELGRKINSTSLNRDGSLRYVSGGAGDSDPLLSDGWKIGWEQ